MFKNYLLTAIRALSRHKISSIISVASLTLGLASALMLWLFIDYHRSFDDFIPKDKNVNRVISKRVDHENDIEYRGYWGISTLASDQLFSDSTQIESVSRLFIEYGNSIGTEEDLYNENTFYVDNTFFEYFPTNVIEGNKNNLFSGTESVVIDSYMANKLFPNQSALGKTVLFRSNSVDKHLLTVTGVIESLPKNTHLNRRESHVYVPFNFFRNNTPGYVFTELESVQIALYFATKKDFVKDQLDKEFNELSGKLPEPKNVKTITYEYENIKDIHLHSKELTNDPSNPKIMIILLATLTLGMCIISIINTVSILTAQSITRTKEVGVRYVLGGVKKNIVFQFLTESILIAFISLIFSMIIAELFIPQFSNMVEIQVNIKYTPLFCLIFILLTLIIGILSGLYPAFYLSSLKVTESLKGKSLLKLDKFKKVLVVCQFTFSSIIIVTALIFNNEMRVLKHMDYGFNHDNLIYLPASLRNQGFEKLASFKEKSKLIKGVKGFTYTSFIPWYGGDMPRSSNSVGGEIVYIHDYLFVDDDYFNVMGLTVLDGTLPVDTGRVAILQTSIHEDFIAGDVIKDYNYTHNINAIIDNYYISNPADTRYPLHMVGNKNLNHALIKIDEQIDMKQLKQLWRNYFPDLAFDYGFISTNIYNFHSGSDAKGIIYSLNIAMIITLFISFLGLFGLLYHSIEQKSKEIGIRKVIGAKYFDILMGFLKEFLLLIIIAILIGIPSGITLVKSALTSISYPFPVSNANLLGLSAALITLLLGAILITVQTRKIILSNPSKTLRYE